MPVVFHDKGAMEKINKITDAKMEEASEIFVERARSNVPVDTGHLKRSIKATKKGPKSYEVTTRTGYGAHVELGTKRMAAWPYFAPAAKQTIEDMKNGGPWV